MPVTSNDIRPITIAGVHSYLHHIGHLTIAFCSLHHRLCMSQAWQRRYTTVSNHTTCYNTLYCASGSLWKGGVPRSQRRERSTSFPEVQAPTHFLVYNRVVRYVANLGKLQQAQVQRTCTYRAIGIFTAHSRSG